MTKVIALFNHKGGVSKTTTAFNLGWMLAEKGHSVVLVDADPQCNLTGMVLGYKGPTELDAFYSSHADQNIYSALAPAFQSRPESIKAVEGLPVAGREGLYLLPGHLGIAEYEVTLGIAQELSAAIQTLQNLPGSLRFLLDLTAEKHQAAYVVIDMSPGLGAINQNLLSTSDYFLVPTSPDFFSVMAIDSLARVLPRWQRWAESAFNVEILRAAAYPFPEPRSRFIGTVVQKYRPRSGAPADAFQGWIDEIAAKVKQNLIPALQSAGMLLPPHAYASASIGADYCLATIPDFNSLIAKSQEHQTPIYSLTEDMLGQAGVVLEASVKSRDTFRTMFEGLADKVIAVTTNAGD